MKSLSFNPTLVQFKQIKELEEEVKRLTFNPTLVQFKLVRMTINKGAVITFNPTLVQFKPTLFLRASTEHCLSILP